VKIKDRDFFKIPFTRREINDLLSGKPAAEMFNFRSPSFKKLDADRDKFTDSDLIDLMLEEPRLVRRPVVRIGKDVYFGADSKALAGILDG
jgi:arsenate reductase-like glutaredoxin family protein